MAVLRNPRTKIRQFFCKDLPFHFTQRQMPSTSGASKVGEPFGFARQPCLEALAVVFASAGDGLRQGFSEDASWSKQMRHDAPKVLIQSWLKGNACCQMQQAFIFKSIIVSKLSADLNIGPSLKQSCRGCSR
mgnify:CR=1 FL=1